MSHRFLFLASAAGACALVGSLISAAQASNAPPFHDSVRSGVRTTTVPGRLVVTDVLNVQNNVSIAKGKLYAHNGAQIWNGLIVTSKGLTVKSGGISADALAVNGPANFANNTTIQGSLQAGAITGSSLAISGTAQVSGLLTANGLNAGSGNITTSGSATVGQLNATSITMTGPLSVASLSTGAISGANGGTLNFTGGVNFAGAQVTGLNGQGGSTNPQTLTVGGSSQFNPPLTISQGGQSSTLGVNNTGQLTVPNGGLAVSGNSTFNGNLTVNGTFNPQTLTTATISGASTSGTPGSLTIQGNTTLNGGSNLLFSIPRSTGGTNINGASHILANGDTDLAGTVTVPVSSSSSINSTSFSFQQPYASTPIVVITPLADPATGQTTSSSGSAATPRWWVTATNTGFTVNVFFSSSSTGGTFTPYQIPFAYHVIGSNG